MHFSRWLARNYQGIAPFASGAVPPAGFSVSGSDQAIDFSWSSGTATEWVIWFNVVNSYSTAVRVFAGGTINGATLNATIGTNADANILPLSQGELVTGTKYYFWLTKGDGSGNAVGPPTSAVTGRSFVIVGATSNTNLRVPYDLGTPSSSGGSSQLGSLIFSSESIPDNSILIHSGNNYQYYTGFGWYNFVTSEPADTDVINGVFYFENPSASSFRFWDVEP